MIYFSAKPVAPQTIITAQWAQVEGFKRTCKDLGLVDEFDDAFQLKAKVTKHLQVCLLNNPYLQSLVTLGTGSSPAAPAATTEPQRAYRMSNEAKALLKAAASTDDGTILKIVWMGGRVVKAGGQSFGAEGGRDAAKWEGALNELLDHGLVVPRGYKDQVFELTHQGWSLADML